MFVRLQYPYIFIAPYVEMYSMVGLIWECQIKIKIIL